MKSNRTVLMPALILLGLVLFAASASATGNDVRRISAASTNTLPLTVVHAFVEEESTPSPVLLKASDGTLYFAVEKGGSAGEGAILRIPPGGTVETVYSFPRVTWGTTTAAALIEFNGAIYGTAGRSLFRLNANGTVDIVHSFPGGPAGHLAVIGSALYGTTVYGGANNGGTVFRVASDGTVEVLHDFSGLGERSPRGGVTLGADGNLYGTLSAGGTSSRGGIFRIGIDGSGYTFIHPFGPSEGREPLAGLTAVGNDLFGTTRFGPADLLYGTLFRLSIDGSFSTLHVFQSTGMPETDLVVMGGKLYGTAPQGGSSSAGTVYTIAPDGSGFAIVHSFTAAEGQRPSALITNGSGSFAGILRSGQGAAKGAVYGLTDTGVFSTIHTFTVTEPAAPSSELVLSGDALYAATDEGGTVSAGTLYKLSIDDVYSTLASFDGVVAGGISRNALTELGGALYGIARPGNSDSTIYRATTGGEISLVHSFAASPTDPIGRLVLHNGLLCGIGIGGGDFGGGTIFGLDGEGAFSSLHSFPGDSYMAISSLVSAGGALYGSKVFWPGPPPGGTVYRVDGESEQTIHSFANDWYTGDLVFADGYLYGVTRNRTESSSIFRISPRGRFQTVHRFTGDDGRRAETALAAVGSSFYGVTYRGGTEQLGSIFRLNPDRSVSLVHSFNGTDGAHPESALVLRGDSLYGTVTKGGSGGGGTIYRLDGVTAPAPSSIVDVVADPYGNGVAEPDETFRFAPRWQNNLSAAVTLTSTAEWFGSSSGYDTASYIVETAAASYGVVQAGETGRCDAPADQCHRLRVSPFGERPAFHWDAEFVELLSDDTYKTWSVHLGSSFADISLSNLFYPAVETLFHHGITTGCNLVERLYCPTAAVSRDQMAAFLGRALAGGEVEIPASGAVDGAPYNCTTGGQSLFDDVAPESMFCRHIHLIRSKNVTTGCAAGQFCPSAETTRGEMAAFVARAIVAPGGDGAIPSSYTDPVSGRAYDCADGVENHFPDVTDGDTFCRQIHFIWAKQVVSGFADGLYRPDLMVVREQMAKFLVNAFGLKLYQP